MLFSFFIILKGFYFFIKKHLKCEKVRSKNITFYYLEGDSINKLYIRFIRLT